FGRGTSVEPANIRAHEGIARNAEIDELGDRNPHVVPSCAVVASPGCSITFRAGIGRAGEHERATIRLKLKQPLIGGACILHSEHVMNLAVVSFSAFNAMHCI